MSWKQKIDPAFDKIVLGFIEFLNAFSLPDKNQDAKERAFEKT